MVPAQTYLSEIRNYLNTDASVNSIIIFRLCRNAVSGVNEKAHLKDDNISS